MSPISLLAPFLVAMPVQDQFPREAWPFVGRWDLTLQTRNGPRPAWLEIEPSGYFVVGRFVGAFGSARPVEGLKIEGDSIRFRLPRQWEKADLEFEAKLQNGTLSGELKSEPRLAGAVKGVKAPDLKTEKWPRWGASKPLFDGRSLEGWKTDRPGTNWSVRKGLLANEGDGVNLISLRQFSDFRLVAEFRYPKGSNSGLYLRGRYEVQIEDGFGHEAHRHGPGAVYGFLVPSENAAKAADDWQRYEIELVGRKITVVYNGRRILDRQTIPGITGGALDSNEGSPGPLYIQGDHGPIEFRKLEVSEPR